MHAARHALSVPSIILLNSFDIVFSPLLPV